MKKVILMIYMMIFLSVSVTVRADIPDNAGVFNGHSYMVYNSYLSWQQAKEYCESQGGHLVTITTKEEQDYLESLLRTSGINNKNYWIGITDQAEEGNWSQWITGEAVTYENWGTNEPDNYDAVKGEQDYGNIYTGYASDRRYGWSLKYGQWDDISVLFKAYFICEWEGGSPVINKLIASSSSEELKGSTYPLLQARAINVKNTSFKLKWNKLSDATKYLIYGNKCGRKNKYVFIKETTKTYYKATKLKKNTFYKYFVVAVNGDQLISISKTVHVGTKTKQNPTKVKVNKTKVSLTTVGTGSTFQIKYKIIGTKLKQHRSIRCETDNGNVAKVTNKGKITAVGIGTCNVYVYAQNGVTAKIHVVVKG